MPLFDLRIPHAERADKAPAQVVENLRKTLAERQIEHWKILERLQQLDS